LEKANVTPNEHRRAAVTPQRGSQQRRQPKRRNPQIAPARAQLEAAARAPENDRDLGRERLTRAKHLLARRRQQITPLLRRWRIQRHLLERRRKKVRLLLGQQQRYRRMLVRRRGKITAELARNRQLTHQLAVATALLERRREKILTGLRQLRDHRSMIDVYETPQLTREFGTLLFRAWKNNLVQWLAIMLLIIGGGALILWPGNFVVTCLIILALGSYPLIALGILAFLSLRLHGYHWNTGDSWFRLSGCVIYSLFIGLLIVALLNNNETRHLLNIAIPSTIIGLGFVVGILMSGVLLYESRH
jgi:hypothetical protein